MDFVLFEPIRYMPGRKIGTQSPIENLVQLQDRVPQHVPLFFADCRETTPNAIAERHDRLQTDISQMTIHLYAGSRQMSARSAHPQGASFRKSVGGVR